MAPPKTTEQLRAIFGLGRPLGMEKSDLEELAAAVTHGRSSRLSQLTFDEANAMIHRLGGDPAPANGATPRRTVNHRKQQAGIKTIASARHVKLIRDLARGRRMTENGIASLAKRMRLPWPPHTTDQGNKLVEALKAMNARDANSISLAKQEAA